MSNILKKIPTKSGFTLVYQPTSRLSVEKEKLIDEPKKSKKLNLKIKSDDLLMIDGLTRLFNISRSQLLEKMIHDILLDELLAIDSKDVRLFLAEKADELANPNSNVASWAYKAFEKEIQSMFHHIRRGDSLQEEQNPTNSKYYNAIVEEFKGFKND